MTNYIEVKIDNKIMRTCLIVDFTVSLDHRVKIKENEKVERFGTWEWRWYQL